MLYNVTLHHSLAVFLSTQRQQLFVDMKVKCILGLVVLVAVSAWAEEEALSTSERIERANRDVVRSPDEPYVEDDVAYDSEAERNADPCTSRGCMWPKSADGKVYVAYVISRVYSPRSVSIIERGLNSFHDFSCLRFVKRTNQRDYLNIQSLNGCYSYIGRRSNGQNLSLSQPGCVYYDTVQHEVLHALGFHHEQKRSDRDQYIRIVLGNVISGKEHNFDKISTLNQGTTYDYGSVMHYSKYAFSKNNQPTLVAIPDSSVQFGVASEMSQKDIIRLNRLYNC
ncbi:hatching enzyme 1.2-like [Sebastes fasciatus]|uniref:hatching enzyme 1.2-like n=1 Tax=Sebastes fasciatus TaxID=394691 RepID=UPI003D9F911A